jgi:hypothetical protein
MAKEIWIPKRIQDAVFEYAEAARVSVDLAERRFVKCFMMIGRQFKVDPQTVVDQVNESAAGDFDAFINGVRDSAK